MRKSVVYIEDEPSDAYLMHRKMLELGHNLQIFYTTSFLKTYLEHIKPDIIVCDVNGTSFMEIDKEIQDIKFKCPVYLTSSIPYKETKHNFILKQDLYEFLKEYLGASNE